MEKTHDALVKLALFCANQARTNTMKDAAREPWRLAVEYRDQAHFFSYSSLSFSACALSG